MINPRAATCPVCDAKPGQPCMYATGTTRYVVHARRERAAEELRCRCGSHPDARPCNRTGCEDLAGICQVCWSQCDLKVPESGALGWKDLRPETMEMIRHLIAADQFIAKGERLNAAELLAEKMEAYLRSIAPPEDVRCGYCGTNDRPQGCVCA